MDMQQPPLPTQESMNPITDFKECLGCHTQYKRSLRPEFQALGRALLEFRDRPEAWESPLNKAGYCPKCESIRQKDEAEQKMIADRDSRIAASKAAELKGLMIEALDSSREGGARPYFDFRLTKYRPELNNTQNWFETAKAFDWRTHNLFVYGPTGSGKTFLSTAIAHEVWLLGGKAEVWDFTKLMRSNMDKTPSEQKAVLSHLKRLDVLVIDDLGLGTATETKFEFLQEILTARYNGYRNGLIVTSNLPLGGDEKLGILGVAEKYGDKIADRIIGMCDTYEINRNTPSARVILKRERKNASQNRADKKESI